MSAVDAGRAGDGLSVAVGAPLVESGVGFTRWMVERWDADQVGWVSRRSGLAAPQGADFHAFGVDSYLTTEVVGNLITNAGWTRLMNLLTNQGATQALDATHARIGVGNGVTAEAYADTDLAASAGSTNRWFQLVSGAGTLGTRTLTLAASFASGDGNFSWSEFGIDFGTASGNTVTAPLFNRKAGIAQGTKASGQVWSASAVITFS
jgi:hypothetical protein